MKALITFTALSLMALSLAACHPSHPHGCPPGQAKKGHCISTHPAAYHCPPGQAKKGKC